ncbi:MAG: anaerobic ribonucleoside-triphosphate reductase activating protein [Lachnospiraceae bacterium]|nr:anaerobic ribonucleoside-triphosphate reductase activating protein [Lachnospiraceae bacterium]
MKISGFQKMTLLDFPGQVAATVFTGGCNLRCPFCHNALLVTELNETEEYSEDFIISYLEKRRGVLDGLAITGGEPLLQKDIRAFIERVRHLGYKVKLDTNGCYPDKLKDLVARNLVDYVAVDVKNSKERYAETVGVPGFSLEPVEETVSFLKKGLVPYEFRTTVVDEFHTLEDILKIGEWIDGADAWFLQNFVDSGNLIGEDLHAAPREFLFAMREEGRKYVRKCELRGVD